MTSVKSLSDAGGVEAAINITENGCTYLTESFSSFRISALELQHLVKISLFHYLPEALREHKTVDKADMADHIIDGGL